MRRIVWALSWLAVALWSLTAWSAYGALNLFTLFVVGNADLAPLPPGSFTTGDPHPLEPLFPFFRALKSMGFAATLLVWLSGCAVLLGTAWLLTRFLPRMHAQLVHRTDLPEGSRRLGFTRQMLERHRPPH